MKFKLVVTGIKAEFFDRRLKLLSLPDGILAYVGGKEVFAYSQEFQARSSREANALARKKIQAILELCYQLDGLFSFECAYEVFRLKIERVSKNSLSQKYPDRRKEPGYAGVH